MRLPCTFPFCHTCVPIVVLHFDIYTAPFLTSACVHLWMLGVISLSSYFFLLAFSDKKKRLLYHVLGPLSFDKVCLIFDQGAQALINKASK